MNYFVRCFTEQTIFKKFIQRKFSNLQTIFNTLFRKFSFSFTKLTILSKNTFEKRFFFSNERFY